MTDSDYRKIAADTLNAIRKAMAWHVTAQCSGCHVCDALFAADDLEATFIACNQEREEAEKRLAKFREDAAHTVDVLNDEMDAAFEADDRVRREYLFAAKKAQALAQAYRQALEQIVEFESGLYANAMGGASRSLAIARSALEQED